MAGLSDDVVAENALEARITNTLIWLAGIPSRSGAEDDVREWLQSQLSALRLSSQVDSAGNLIARVPAVPESRDHEAPILLNAHMDRVPPGEAHLPVIEDGIMRSDGTTNLGADNGAGIAIVLHTAEELYRRGLSHPPLLLVFTAGEEVGLHGSKGFDPEPWGVREGIVFDNAGEPGAVVTRAATYIAFDVTLHGTGGHPGKGFDGTASAIEMFRQARYPTGTLHEGQTRVSIGRIEGGTMRNAVPAEARILGEMRTLLGADARERLMREIADAFTSAAESLGGSVEISFDSHCDGYEVDLDEPLLRAWKRELDARGEPLRTETSFIGSDASAFRPRVRVFTVSTGAMREHTLDEWVAIPPLVELVETAVSVLGAYEARS